MTDYLLQESGSRLTLEDGSGFLLLESSTVVVGPWMVIPRDASVGGISASDALVGRLTMTDTLRGSVTGSDAKVGDLSISDTSGDVTVDDA